MTPWVRGLLIGLAAWLAGAGLAFAADRPAPAGEPGHQVLVMLRLPLQHFRPNSDYVDSYGDGLSRGALHRLASRLAHEQHLILVDDWPMPLLGVDCFVMQAPADRSPAEVAARLSREPAVAWSEPMALYHTQGAAPPGGQRPAGAGGHNDPLFLAQPAAREWRLAELHQLSTGRNVRVAVIDSQIDQAHPDLVGQVYLSQNFVPGRPAGPEAHGTGVAGIIAARADNGLGIAGVAPHARLMALRACWPLASNPAGAVCSSLSLAQALDFAIAHDAQVINLSLSGPPGVLLGKLIDAARGRGAEVVAAYDRGLPGGGFPASHPGVVAVVDEGLPAAPPGVYSAPGRDVPTTLPGGRWSLVSGSSYAAAHVSGLLALVSERRTLQQRALALVVPRAGPGPPSAVASLVRVSGRDDCACAHAR